MPSHKEKGTFIKKSVGIAVFKNGEKQIQALQMKTIILMNNMGKMQQMLCKV